MRDCGFQLGVLPLEGRVRQVIDHHVWIDAVTLDQPVSFRTEHSGFCGGCNAAVHEEVAGRQPDLAAPGPGAYDLAQTEASESFCERFAVRRGVLVGEDDHVAAEGVLL